MLTDTKNTVNLKYTLRFFISNLASLNVQTGGQYKHQGVRLTACIDLQMPSAIGIKWRRISQIDGL
jgi:hypothetical protein